jgi:YD repeat-containing protein
MADHRLRFAHALLADISRLGCYHAYRWFGHGTRLEQHTCVGGAERWGL